MIDVLLLPFGVGTHVVGPLQILRPRKTQVLLGNHIFRTHPRTWVGVPRAMGRPNLGGRIPYSTAMLSVFVHFCTKNADFGLKTTIFSGFLGHFCHFLKNSLISLGFLGHAWSRPEENWAGPEFGRRGNTPCKRIDELFKPNWPPDPPPDPSRPPQTPQEVLK